VLEGELRGTPVLLGCTDSGRLQAARGVEAILGAFPIRLLASVGVAGGLAPSLDRGSLVLARRVLDGLEPGPAPDPSWLQRALRVGGAAAGTALCSPHVLSTAAAKAAAWAELDTVEPAVVDLESAAIAVAAARHRMPFLVVRSVCDPAHEDLPLDFDRCRDRSGAIRRTRVVRAALRRPRTLGALWDLRRRVARCARDLADWTERLVEGDGP
jgi:adenosylhomocysteine nucleosidase